MSELAWWQRGVIYQIYPRSFQDSNGDGIGDLAGMSSRLPYLAELGVDAVWVSPIYPSPMADFGYDVADYCNIDPMFGTLADFKQFADRAHGLGMKVLLDFVPNHSSDRHPWFEESRSSRDNPKRDWYLWRDPAPGGGSRPTTGRAAWGEVRVGMGRAYRPVLLSRVPARTAGSELAQPAGAPRDGRRAAVLARSRRRRLSCRRAVASHQGRAVPRQSAEPRL